MEEIPLNLLFWLVFPVLIALLGYAGYFFLSLPLRRQERARLFLDLLEMGFGQGRSAEQTIRAVAESGDRALGVRFHLLAAHLDAGRSLDQALERVPRLLPPSVVAMLRAGREVGDVRKVLPACRHRLEDGTSSVWSAHNYLMLVALVISPLWMLTFWTLMVFVIPKFEQIFADMTEGAAMPGLTLFFMANHHGVLWLQVAILLFFYAAVLGYVGGARLRGWIAKLLPGLPDRIAWLIPWCRKRLQRDFSSVLAVLLDAGVPEAQALELAGASTANGVLRRRASLAVGDLERGMTLPEAVRRLDDAGEFRWRLDNAAQGPEGFMAALAGWHEALSAKAFQLEQTMAQVVTTSLVLLNGVFVGALAVAVFGLLIGILKGGLLW